MVAQATGEKYTTFLEFRPRLLLAFSSRTMMNDLIPYSVLYVTWQPAISLCTECPG